MSQIQGPVNVPSHKAGVPVKVYPGSGKIGHGKGGGSGVVVGPASK